MTVKSDEVASVMLGCLQFFYKAYRNSVVTVVIMDLLVVNPEDAIDMDLHARALDNEECERQLDYLSNNIDSSARLPSGLLSLNINEFGDYHQCLSINNTVDGITFLGKHCQIMNAAVKPINISTTFEAWCMCAEAMPRSPISKVLHTKTISRSKLRGFLTALFLVTALSTGYDLYQTFVKNVAPSKSLLSSFSVYTNTRRFLTFRKSKSALECVDGIRALSMFWVIIGHSYIMRFYTPTHNITGMLEWIPMVTSSWINSAPLVVDTFFLLSGIFCIYSIPNKVGATLFLKNLHVFYLYRLLRLLPLLATVVLLQMSIVNWLSDGPDWPKLAYATGCLYQTWYLTVDTQLYMLSPLVLIFLFGSRKIAWSVMTLTLIASLITVTYYAFNYDIPVVIVLENTKNLYEKILRPYSGESCTICYRHNVRVYIEDISRKNYSITKGPIEWFLSLTIWKLPSRMSYAVYLVHLPVIMIRTNGMLKSEYFTDLETCRRKPAKR
ncbi:unnamed protein product [Leptidea sinapis]|uniref:Uncharacterized protein n=1 Tax=Leptidea sinapis TaxID=189913 RepID=A0A5E4R7V2_9NEOP|nr:unnamed protein product [Leptidea sinapis]